MFHAALGNNVPFSVDVCTRNNREALRNDVFIYALR